MSSVDVVVPCYNYARFLERCVDSVLSQEGVDVRVLIIDDASPDNTPTVARRLVERDSRVEYRRHATNCGHIATYNEGLLGWASAKYSLLLSADDALAPGALARAVSVMDQDESIGMTYGMALIIADDSDIPEVHETGPVTHQVISGERFLERCCARGNPVPTPTAVVRTSLQHRLGGYRPELPHSGDMEMWMRFAIHAPVAVLDCVQAYYRLHGANMSTLYYERWTADRREQFEACAEVFSRWGAHLPQALTWLEAMSRRLGEEAFWTASTAFDQGNMQAFRHCLDFALEFHPGLRRTAAWWRFQAKRMLGPTLWGRIRPVFNRLRGMSDVPSWSLSASWQPQTGRTCGWWPQPS